MEKNLPRSGGKKGIKTIFQTSLHEEIK
jgi:hypothetical protein